MTRTAGRRALRLAAYLRHIVEAVERIQQYVAGMGADDFAHQPMVQDAVIRNFEIIGEASRNVLRHNPDFAAAHPEVPWQLAYEMRNALSHGYFSVDLDRVWTAIHANLPGFAASVRALLQEVEQTG